MELEYKDNGRRGKFIMVLGVLFAIVAGGAAFYLINQAQAEAGSIERPRVNAVVAVRDIPGRKPIEPDDVALRQVPADETNIQRFETVEDVVGRTSAVTILTGQLVTRNLLASTTAGSQFSILGPEETIAPDSPHWRAVALNVPDDRAVGGLIQAGQFVDVFVTVTVNVPQALLDAGRFYTDRSTKVTYQDLPILTKSGTYYVVKVDEATAEEISHLQATGNATFSLALRPDGDNRRVDPALFGETTNRIIEDYAYPIPETYPRR